MSPVATAQAVRLFTTRSKRSRGDTPKAVAERISTGENRSSASGASSTSAAALERPYGVTGRNSPSSAMKSCPAAP